MSLFSRVADLPVTIEDTERTRQIRGTSSGFDRHTTTFSLSGAGETGRGEDVAYEAADHEALAEAGSLDLTGEYTVAGFSDHLVDVSLFPTAKPSSPAAKRYRRWGVESAALDLALKQAETDLGTELNRTYDPVRFVVSTRLPDGDPERVTQLLAAVPDSEFKLDPTTEWDEETISALKTTDVVRILDLKGQYDDFEADQLTSADRYRSLLTAFPDAIIEDPLITPETRPAIAEVQDRLSWDAPITDRDSLDALPYEPSWINVKPSRFGSIESLFDTIEYCLESNISLYGGGQFELDVGRSHIQALAALFYPSGPNDVAPGEYNEPTVPTDPQPSPLNLEHGPSGII